MPARILEKEDASATSRDTHDVEDNALRAIDESPNGGSNRGSNRGSNGGSNRDDEEGDGNNDNEPWLTIATFWQQMEAHIARLKLESEEIDCFLFDENLVSNDWLMANAVGGIKLQVRQSDAENAMKILAMHRPGDSVPKLSEEPVSDGLEKCPRCGSDDISIRWGFKKSLGLVALLIASLPFAIPTKRWTCGDCGFRW